MQAEAELANPTGLEGYCLGRRIAVGGMAEVFEAQDLRRDTSVVIKILLPDLCLDADVLQMFADEAKLTTTVAHDNLVRTIDTGETDGRPFLVMEFVDGCTLHELIRRGGALPLPLAARVTHDVLHGLCYLHGCTDDSGTPLQIVHRDVNPRNVLISRQGEVKLADFGIARWRLRAARTRSGVIKGTVQYMCPEQITGSDPDHRADLYGVGLVLFEMLTGHPYIEAASEVELLRLAESPPSRPASRVKAGLPAAIDGVLQPALMRFPEQRYRNAAAFASALSSTMASVGQALADAGELGALVETVASASAQKAEIRRRKAAAPALSPRKTIPAANPTASDSPRRWTLALVAASLGVLAVGGAAYWVWQAPSEGGSPAERGGERSVTRTPVQRLPRASTQVLQRDQNASAAPAPAVRPEAIRAVASDPARPQLTGLSRPSAPSSNGRRSRRGVRSDNGSNTDERPGAKRNASRAKPVVQKTPAVAPEPKPPAADIEPLRARWRQVLSTMQRRGIRVDDLGPKGKAHWGQAQRKLDSGEAVAAEGHLTAVEQQVSALSIDRKFLRGKLQRVDRRLRSLPAHRSDVARLRQKSTEAIQAFMDGNFEQANRQLNRILQLLP